MMLQLFHHDKKVMKSIAGTKSTPQRNTSPHQKGTRRLLQANNTRKNTPHYTATVNKIRQDWHGKAYTLFFDLFKTIFQPKKPINHNISTHKICL